MPVTAPLRQSTARHEATCVSTKEASSRTRVDSALHFFSSRINSSTEEIMVRAFDLSVSAFRSRSVFPTQFARLCPRRVRDEGIEFLQQRSIALPGISRQFFTIVRQ